MCARDEVAGSYGDKQELRMTKREDRVYWCSGGERVVLVSCLGLTYQMVWVVRYAALCKYSEEACILDLMHCWSGMCPIALYPDQKVRSMLLHGPRVAWLTAVRLLVCHSNPNVGAKGKAMKL